MRLNAAGHPLHTRSQTIAIHRDDAGAVLAQASHLDLRKRGFVPVGSFLQSSGIIHRMEVRAEIDPLAATLERAEVAMPAVAFDASPTTGGESCRDVAGELPGLSGASLRAGWAQSLGAVMGGRLGCSHVLSLSQHLGAAAGHALESAPGGAVAWSEGPARRLFHRTLVIDGSEAADGAIDLAAQLTELHLAPAAGVCNPMDSFAEQLEIRLLARVDLGRGVLSSIEVAERRRDRDTLATADWRRRDPLVQPLCGIGFIGGFARAVLDRHPQPGRDRPLIDILLALPPAFLQVCACFSETWPQRAMASDTVVGIGGTADSCYMWRGGGALDRRKKDSDPGPV